RALRTADQCQLGASQAPVVGYGQQATRPAATRPDGRMRMDTTTLALGALVGLAIGLGLGYIAKSQLASQSIKAATEKAARIVSDANARQKDLILEAKEEKIRL